MLGVHLAVDLVNLDVDELWAGSAVEAALTRGAITFDGVDPASLAELRDWAGRLTPIFAAGGPGERCAAINALLADGVRRVHLSIHDDMPAHLHFNDDESDVVTRVRGHTIGGIAVFAVETEAGRMGVCGRPGCPRVFADTSKNGRRAYCTALCGNGHAVQRYRERRGRRPAGVVSGARVPDGRG